MTLLKCLEEAGIEKSQLSDVEVVGGSVRIASVKRKIGEILGLDASALNYGLKTTMNSDEAVARGGALNCAMVSSRMKVKPFEIIDKISYGIVVNFDGASNGTTEESLGDESKDDVIAHGNSARIFLRGDDFGSNNIRRLTFYGKTTDFSITAAYDGAAEEILPPGEDKVIAKYTIRVPSELTANGSRPIRVSFILDKHYCLHVKDAVLFEAITDTSSTADAPMDVATEGKDEKDSKDEEKKSPPAEIEKKELTRKHNLVVVTEQFGLTKEQIKASIELEVSMAFEDKLITETADKRNELEAYIYGMRDRIDGVLGPYATSAEKDGLRSQMTAAEDWLYGDGFDSTKQNYVRRIEDLRKFGDPIENRYNEEQNRQPAIEQLQKQISLCRTFITNFDDAYSHITNDERDKLRNEVSKVEGWLSDMNAQQNKLPKSTNPILTPDAITKQRNALFKVSSPIMTKQKPAPPAPPASAASTDNKDSESKENPPPTGTEENSESKSDEKEETKDATSTDDKKGEESVPMDT